MSGCAAIGGGPVEVIERFAAEGAPAVEVRVVVQPEHRRQAAGYARGAVAALATVTPWLGAPPFASVTIVDPPVPPGRKADASIVVLDRTPWWSLRTSMTPEIAAARALAKGRWSEAIDVGGLPSWFADGLVEYTARRAVVPLFQGDNLPPGYAMLEPRYFGGFVPWFVRIRLLPESDGDPLPAYRKKPRASAVPPTSAEDQRSLTAKTVLTLNTLERWISRPVFDGVLAELARQFRKGRPTLVDFERVASETAGQDLSWLFEHTLDGSEIFDYAVADLRSVPAAGGGFDTTVVIERRGDGMFTGSSAPRVGPFESGRGLTIAVAFEDALQMEVWDGRDARKTFAYHSLSRAVSATVDPDRTLLLDVNRTNNSRAMAAPGSRAASRWAARWMAWLEHALLDYAVLV